jgi:hypothetical protein
MSADPGELLRLAIPLWFASSPRRVAPPIQDFVCADVEQLRLYWLKP